MFFGSNLHQFLTPKNAWFEVGYLKTTELPLSAADANSPTAVLKSGKMVAMKDNDDTLMKLGTGFAIGVLTRPVSLNGTKTVDIYQRLSLGVRGYDQDIPQTRGLAVTVQRPLPGAQCIFEGAADITGAGTVLQAIDHLVVKTGTGAISAATAVMTELSVLNGAWRVAQTGDWVIGLNMQSNYTPNVAGNIRIRVEFISPYKKA